MPGPRGSPAATDSAPPVSATARLPAGRATGAAAAGPRCRSGDGRSAAALPLRAGVDLTRKFEHVPQRGKVVERQSSARLHRRPQGTDVEILLQLAEELSLLDAVDAQVGFQIGVQIDDFGRIAGLLDDEVDQERFQLGGTGAGRTASVPRLCDRMRRRGGRGPCRRRLRRAMMAGPRPLVAPLPWPVLCAVGAAGSRLGSRLPVCAATRRGAWQAAQCLAAGGGRPRRPVHCCLAAGAAGFRDRRCAGCRRPAAGRGFAAAGGRRLLAARDRPEPFADRIFSRRRSVASK